MRVIVRAGNQAQFMDWCSLHRVNPRAAHFVPYDEAFEERPGDVVVDLRFAALAPAVWPLDQVVSAA